MANKIDFKIGLGIGISAHSLYIVSTSDGGYNSGAVRIAGGASIGRTLSLSGSLLLQNGANYTGLKSSASSNTIYTLPNQYPATGTSVLQSDTTGQMAWVPMVASVGGGSGSGTVDYGLQYRLATYPSAGTLVTNSDITYNPSTTKLSFSNLTFVGNGNSAISISGVGNGGQILTTWDTLNSGLSLDASNASLRIVGDTNAGTTLVDLGVYDNSGFPTGNWNSKYLFPKTTNAIFVNGLSITNSTVSTSTSTGALVITGGVGIGGSLFLTSSLPSSLSGVVVSNGVVTSGSWAGSLITGIYGGTGFNSYTKGDILVGAGNTFIKLPVGTDNYVLTASSSTATGLTWSPTASTGLTTLNGLNTSIQYLSFDYSGTVPAFSSSGSTHTLNIPLASSGATGLVTSQAQTIGGAKTFADDTSITSATSSISSATGALKVTGGVGIGGSLYVASATAISGVTIDNGVITGNLTGFATTARNLNVNAASASSPHYILFSPSASGSGIAVSSLSSLTVNPVTNVISIGSGTFAANGVSIGSASNTITTSSGQLNLDSVSGQINLNDNVVVQGNLTVQGTTITVDSTISTFVDPVVVLGSGAGGTHSTLDNNQDRGIEFRWSNAGTATTGFFGFNDTDGKFRFIPNASLPSANVYTGTAGTAVFGTVEATLAGNASGTAATYTNFYGSLTGTASTATYAHQSGYAITAGSSSIATTATNVNISSTSNAVGPFYFAMTTASSGSGVALSTDTALQYNSASDVLSLSYLTGTAITATTSFNGPLIGNVTGTATSSANVHLVNATSNSPHRLVFSPTSTGSGVALSSSAQVSYNPSTFVLSSSGIAVTSSTNSSSSGSGALIVTGGVGIGQSLSIDGRIQFFNGANYTAFVSAATANTVYILPATSPATGSSVLQSTSTGILSWVPLVASASGTTAQNIVVNSAGSADVFHPLLFTPSQITSGSAVSSDSLLSYNANSDRLFVSGIFVTSGTASTSTFTGGLLVAGGIGVSGQISFTRASLGFTGVTGTPSMAFIGATTSSYISLNVLSDNSLSFEGSSGQLFSIDNNLTTGEIFSVSDISGLPVISASAGQTVTLNEFGGVTKIGDGTANATSTTNAALVVSGGLGITGNAFIGGTATVTNTTISSSSSTGAFVVSGGVGIGGSLYTSSSNANSISGVVLSNSVVRLGTWAATAITSFYGGTGHSNYTVGDLLVGAGGTLAKLAAGASNYVLTSNGAGTVPSWQAVPPSAASSVAVTTSALDQSFFVTFVSVANGSGLGLTTSTSFVINPSSGLVTASGLALTNLTNATSTSSGALRVSGGLGLTGNAFIGGTINAPSTNQSNISNVYFTNGNVTGTSVTATTIQGTLVGTATTATNSHLATTGNAVGPFYLAMSASSTGSGVALSTDTSLSYNSSSDVLTVPYVSGTAITASTSFSGPLFGDVTGTATTATYAHQSGYGITAGIATTARNIHLASTGNVAGPFYLTMSASSSGSGIALSSDTSLSYNSASDVLTVSYISGTAITASTSFSGQLFGNVTGTATTSRNSFVNVATSATDHYIIFSPNSSGSGVALSSGSSLVFNPSQNVLSVGNGIFAANGISVGAASNTITTASGNLNLDSVSGQTNINDNVVIQGNLTVQGTTLTVDSTVSTFVDPVVVLGSGVGGTHSTLDNNQDRGIEFRWSNSGTATTGFFGFNDNDGKFRFIPNASISSSNVYTGTAGTAVFGTVEAILSGNSSGTASTYTNFYGSLTGTASTSTNVHLASTGNAVGPFYLALSSGSSGAGLALSSDTALSYNSSSDVLTVSYVSGTAITASTSFSGQLFGNVTGTASTSTYSHQSGYGITAGTATTATNIHLAAGASASNHSVVFSLNATGSGVALSTDSSLLYNPNTDTLSSTNFSGNLTGFATTARNLDVVNATANSAHTIYFGPVATGSGVALSSNRTISFNPSSFILSTSGLAVTSAAVSTSTTSGALIVTGGIGVGGTIYIGGDAFISSATASTWAANGALRVQGGLGVSGQLSFNQAALGYTGASNPSIAFIGSTTSAPITMTVLSDNSLIFEGTSGKLFGINNNLSSGWIFNVGDISGLPLIRANADGTIAMTEYAGNVGIGLSNPAYKLHVTGSVGFTSSVGSTNTTTGALIVSGGVGIGQSISIGGRIQFFNGANFTAFVSSATGNTVYTLPATSPATGSSVLSSTSTGVMSWVPLVAGSSSGTVNSGTATYAAFYATTTNAVSENANLQFTGTGLSVGGNINSISTRSGSLYVYGGVGITGNAFIGGTTTIQSSATSSSSTTGALVVSGGVGIGSDLFVGTSINVNSGANGLLLQKAVGASLGAIYSTNVTPSTSNYTLATDGNNLNLNSITNFYLNISNTVKATLTTNNFAVNINVASTNSSSGAFTVSGGAGIAGSLYVANASRFESSTAAISSATGALTVTGGVGIGGSLYVANPSRFESNTVSTSSTTGSVVIAGGVGIGGSLYVANPSRFEASTVSISYSTGAIVVAGGVGIGGSLFVANPSRFESNTASISSNTGALTVSGGAGIAGSLFVANASRFESSAASVSTTSGALVVAGGVGIGGSLYVGSASRYSDTTQSSTTTSGAIVVSGGVGIGQSVSVGGRLQIFNGANHTAFVSSATGNTVYTLPATSPAIGTSYLVSNSAGVMSWIRPKRSYVLSFGAGFTPSANAADTVQINIPYAPDNVALNYIVKRVEYRNETVSGGTGLSFYIERHTGGDALWSTAHRIHAGSGASFEVGALVNQISFTTINSSSGTNGLVASGDYIRLYFTTVGSAANVSISLTIEEQ